MGKASHVNREYGMNQVVTRGEIDGSMVMSRVERECGNDYSLSPKIYSPHYF